jgi:hypothetical protein
MRRASLSLALAACTACTPEVPAAPSYQADVMPILAANCIRCHGGPPLGGAPRAFRLDSYADLAAPDPAGPPGEVPIAGAAAYAAAIALRVRDPDRPMPPRFPLDDWQIEVLERWAAIEAPRGTPRPGNRPPSIALERVTTAGGAVSVRVRVGDPDGDVVAGTLRAQVGAEQRLVGAVRSGIVELAWVPAGVGPGTYPLVASLDDGAEVHQIPAGEIAVPP